MVSLECIHNCTLRLKKFCGIVNRKISIPFAALFVVSLVALCWAYQSGSGDADNLSAWIQAGGSVLAIIASFWIVSLDKMSKQQERQQDILALAEAAHYFSQRIREMLDSSHPKEGMVNPKLFDIYHSSVATAYAKALANTPFYEVGSATAVQALLSMHVQFAHFLDPSIQVLMSGLGNNQHFQEGLAALDRQYQEPELTVEKIKLRERYFCVLVQNVRGHLDSIDKDFLTFKKEIMERS